MVRIKERYLLVNILYPDALRDAKPSQPDLAVLHRPTTNDLGPPAILRAIRAQVGLLFGEYGAGLIERGLQVKYLSNATSSFILRVHREHYRLVWAALTLLDRVPIKNGPPCVFRVAHVSGTMRKVEIAAIRRSKALLLAVEKQMVGKEFDVLETLFGGAPADKLRAVVADVVDEAHEEDDEGGAADEFFGFDSSDGS